MSSSILNSINSPADLKKIKDENIPKLCAEIRDFLIENVEKTGGHLASNLGVVELSVAIHRVFDSPKDHIIFDVGHQAYVHKILTGRKEQFGSLRQPGGLSGFTNMSESEHDAFGAGHSSTSISAALGYAESDRILGNDSYTVAVVGDGAFTGGMIHEAINNCKDNQRLVIIINENGMSISTNKGAFASYLSRARGSKRYISWKRGTKSFLHKTAFGRGIERFLAFVKGGIKGTFLRENYFEDLGLYYIGGVDGNNYKKVEDALQGAKDIAKCVVVHVKTVKGKGYNPAEKSPDSFHSIGSEKKSMHFPDVVSSELVSLAESDEKIVAITAAMGIGTGLSAFEDKFPQRYFDVGIAEEHAVTFSAGLAAAGLKPFVAIYSTFLQRAYDNIIHDIALQNLPVKILIDRAGLSVKDGATHHGIFDVAFLSTIPGIEILAPITNGSLKEALKYATEVSHPIAIRYPNSPESSLVADRFYADGNYKEFGIRCDFGVNDTLDAVIITYGSIVNRVISFAEMMKKKDKKVGIILVERIKPYDSLALEILPYLKKSKRTLFVEEGIKSGGAAMNLASAFAFCGADPSEFGYRIIAIDDTFGIPDSETDLYDYLGFSNSGFLKMIFDEE